MQQAKKLDLNVNSEVNKESFGKERVVGIEVTLMLKSILKFYLCGLSSAKQHLFAGRASIEVL